MLLSCLSDSYFQIYLTGEIKWKHWNLYATVILTDSFARCVKSPPSELVVIAAIQFFYAIQIGIIHKL